jgi:integrase
MPLRVERRKDTGTLFIVGTVRPAGAKVGRRIRQRAGTDDERLAREEAALIEASILRDAHIGERPSSHSFAEAATSYLKHTPRSPGTKAYLRRLLIHFQEIPLGAINQEAVDRARDQIMQQGATGSAWRRIMATLTAVLNHAAKRRWCDEPHFDLPPPSKGRLTFFVPDQAEAMIREGRHLAPLIRFLFCSGCRLGEALSLDWSDVDLTAARAILWEGETKSGNRRVVGLTPGAIAALAALEHRAGRVFRTHRGEPYREEGGYGGQIKTAWQATMRRAGLSGFGPHHTRHSWASWHYALNRDLLLLQREGGWSSVTLVARYAHVMPSGVEAAIRRVWGISGLVLMEKKG